MTVKEFNESHAVVFSHSQPVPRALQIFKHWVGAGNLVIDIGCGSGYYGDICHRLGNQVVGVDITNQVQAASALSIQVCIGNVEEALPYPNEHFTLALCMDVIEHLLQPDLMLAEANRVLRPGAVLLMSTPNYSYWVLRFFYLLGKVPSQVQGRPFEGFFKRSPSSHNPEWRDPHIRYFNPQLLREMLTQSGFEVQEIRSAFVAFPSGLAPHVPLLFALPLRIIGKLVGNLDFLGDVFPSFLGAGILVKAIKR